MSDLTRLTITAAREGLALGHFSAIELTEAYLAAIEPAGDLNAYVLATPDKALRHGQGERRKDRRRHGRPAGRHSARHQGPVRDRRHPHHRVLEHPAQLRAAIRIHRHRQSLARRRGAARQAEP